MTETPKPKKGSAGDVEVPKEFLVSGIDQNPSWTELRGICNEMEIDHSGPDKVLRNLRPVAWDGHCIGGGATRNLASLSQFRLTLSANERNLARLQEKKAEPNVIEMVEAGVRGAKLNLDRLEKLVSAAGDFHLDDQIARRDRMKKAERDLDETRNRLKPFRRARIGGNQSAEVLALEREEFKREKAASEAAASFWAGAAELEIISKKVKKLMTQFFQAATACGATACRVLGQRAEDLILPNVEFLAFAPHRIPPEVKVLYRKAGVLNDLMGKLSVGDKDRGMLAFLEGCGHVAPIVKEGLGITGFPFIGEHESNPADALMRSTV